MSLVKIKIKLLIITMLMLNSVYAIDISVTNGNITPSTIPAFSTYTLSVDINNQGMPPATNPEEAVFLVLSITGYDPTNVGGIAGHTAGWTCAINTGSIDCDRALTNGEFPFGTSQPFSIDINTNSIVTNPDTFNVISSDESGLTEDNFADNSLSISSIAGGVDPDLDFDDGTTLLNYNGVENQVAPILMDFRVLNLGGDSPLGGSMFITYDDLSLGFDPQASTIPFGWNCFPTTGGLDCSTNDPIGPSSTTDFQLAFIAGPQGSYAFNGNLQVFSATDSNPANNGINTNIILSAAGVDPDVEVLKSFLSGIFFDKSGPIAEQNTLVTYEILVRNNTSGSNPATNVFIDDYLPAGVTFDSFNEIGPNFNCSYNAVPARGGPLVSCSAASLPFTPSDDGVEITVNVTGPIGSMIDNTATVGADIDTNPGNNSSNTGTFEVVGPIPIVDLVMFKDAESLSGVPSTDYLVNEHFNYKLTVGNFGTATVPADEVVVTDTVPPGLDIINVSTPEAWNCSSSDFPNGMVRCVTEFDIQPSTDYEIFIEVVSQVAGNYDNTASVQLIGSTLFDIDPNNNDDNVVVNITATGMVDLDLLKDAQTVGGSTSVVNFVEGQSFEYKLVVHNTGPNAAPIGDVVLTDVLPVGITLEGIPNSPEWDCSGTVGTTINCVNTQPISGVSGFLTLIIPVNGQDAGAYLNSADVAIMSGSSVNDTNPGNNSGSVNVTISLASGNLTLVKSVTGGSAQARSKNKFLGNISFAVGDTVTYTLLAQNTSASNPVNDIVITDVLDPNFLSFNSINIIQSAANFSCSFDGTSQVTCTNSSGGAFNPGDFFEVEILATAVDVGLGVSNTAQIASVSTGDNFNSNTVVIDISIGALSTTLSVDKQALVNGQSVTSVKKGTAFNYRVNVQNTGAEDAQNLSLVDNMPTGVVVNSATGTGWTCANTGQQYTCNFSGPLLPSASSFVEFDVVDGSAANNTQLQNVVDVSADNASIVSDVNTINLTTDTDADLSIVKTASVTTASVNENFNYVLTVTNNSTFSAIDIVVTDSLPDGLVFNSIDANGWSCIGESIIICSIVTMDANSTETITIDVNAPSIAGNVLNSATVLIGGNDPVSSNNSSEVLINVSGTSQSSISDLLATKTASDKVVTSGEQFSWNIDIKNDGPDNAGNVIAIDQLPAGFNLISATINGGAACQSNKGELMCDLGTLLNGELQSVTVIGTATLDEGLLENTVTVTSNSSDPDPTNNLDTASILVNPMLNNADMSVVIMAEAQNMNSNTAEFNVVVTNNGPDAAHVPTLNMLASGPLNSIVLDVGSDWTCQVNKLVAISCDFNSQDMPSGQQSAVNVKLNSVVSDSNNIQILGLSATVASQSQDPDASNNMAISEIEVGINPTEQEILTAFQDALAGIGNQQTQRAIRNVASYCGSTYEDALEGLCDNLYNAALAGDGETLNNVIEQITPNEIAGQSSSVSEIASAQFRNVGTRLSQLRGGGGSGFSSAGLNARYGNGSIPIGMLAYLNDSETDKEGLQKPDPMFISPWGFFVNGTISMGERDATGRELGFDFDSYGLTAGVDYRLDSNKVLGLALGYASFDSKTEGSSELNSTGLTLTGYGSFYVKDNFYIDTRISIAKPDFDQTRKIDFDIDDISVHRIAKGKTNANQYSFAMSTGYHINKDSWNITPNASVNYVNTNIDEFTETGAGEFNFIYTKQEIESLVWSVGLKASKAISLKNGVITPQFDFDYNYESLNDGNNIGARFIMAPDDEIFIIETDSPDRTYGSAGVGLVYITSNGKQAYINYRSLLGLEGFSRGTFNIGARFEF